MSDAPEDEPPEDEPPEDERDEEESPLSDLAREVRERRAQAEAERAEAEPGAEENLFERVEVGEIDREAVWESVVEEGPEAREAELQTRLGGPGSVTEVEAEEAGDVRLLDKRDYCQRCPYLSEPPGVACTHDGTDIIEVVDAGTFRVRNCPVVSEGEGPPTFE